MTQRGSDLKIHPCSVIPSGDSPLEVHSGLNVTTVITDSQRAYTWGRGDPHTRYMRGRITAIGHAKGYTIAIADGRLFAGGKGPPGSMPGKRKDGTIPFPNRVDGLAVGEGFTLVLSGGSIHGSGCNNAYQLGLGHNTTPVRSFSPIPLPAQVVRIAASSNHAAAVTSSGELYMWGHNDSHRLGLPQSTVQAPTLLTALKDALVFVTDVSLGSAHSGCLSDQGDVYCWGWNEYGQCALDPTVTMPESGGKGNPKPEKSVVPTPTLALENQTVTTLSLGQAHTAAVTAAGVLYTFGFNDEGQLGHGGEVSTHIPTVVDLDGRCLSVSCGSTHTSAVVSNLTETQNQVRRNVAARKRSAATVLLKFTRACLFRILLRKYKPAPRVKAKPRPVKLVEAEPEVDLDAVRRLEEAKALEEAEKREREIAARREKEAEEARRRKEEAEERRRLAAEENLRKRMELAQEESERLHMALEEERMRMHMRQLKEAERKAAEERERRRMLAEEEERRFRENELMRIEDERGQESRAVRKARMLKAKAAREAKEKEATERKLAREVQRMQDLKKAADRFKKGREKKEKKIPTMKRSGSAGGLRDSDMHERLKQMADERKVKELKEKEEQARREEKEREEKERRERARRKMVEKREARLRAEKEAQERQEAEEMAAREAELALFAQLEKAAREEEVREQESSRRRLAELQRKASLPLPHPLAPTTAPVNPAAPSGPAFQSVTGWGRKLSKASSTGVDSKRGKAKKVHVLTNNGIGNFGH